MKAIPLFIVSINLLADGISAAPAPQAPTSVSGCAIGAQITSGTGPFATQGYFLFIPANTGSSYQLIGVNGTSGSTGTYSYTSSNANAYVTFVDTAADTGNGTFHFTNANSGTYILTSGPYQQTGNFVFSSVPAPTTLASKSIHNTADLGSYPFASSGTAVFTVSSGGSSYTITPVTQGIASSHGTFVYSRANSSVGTLSVQDSVGGNYAAYFAYTNSDSGLFLCYQASSEAFQVGNFATSSSVPAPFFNGQVDLGGNVEYLTFPSGTNFGYYNLGFPFPFFYHYDLGFEYFFDASNANHGCYLYDFSSGTFFYTDIVAFPSLYDFTVNSWIYYYPNTTNSGHYTSNPRYFYNFTTTNIFTK